MQLRLDSMLVENGFAKSRERAKELIKNGGVTVNGKEITKPSFAVSEADDVKVTAEQLRYVSRGGLKLEKAVLEFDLKLSDMTCVDLGASTGGFTDCMLQNGAKKVYAVDVGHGQLDESLVNDPSVVNIEGVNVKEISADYIGERVDFVTADLSFISVKNSLYAIKDLLKPDSFGVILIKPQFEVGKANIGKGGIVKDRSAHVNMLSELIPFIEHSGLCIKGLTVSAVKGGDGNIEYLALLKNQNADIPFLNNFNIKDFVIKSFVKMK